MCYEHEPYRKRTILICSAVQISHIYGRVSIVKLSIRSSLLRFQCMYNVHVCVCVYLLVYKINVLYMNSSLSVLMNVMHKCFTLLAMNSLCLLSNNNNNKIKRQKKNYIRVHSQENELCRISL